MLPNHLHTTHSSAAERKKIKTIKTARKINRDQAHRRNLPRGEALKGVNNKQQPIERKWCGAMMLQRRSVQHFGFGSRCEYSWLPAYSNSGIWGGSNCSEKEASRSIPSHRSLTRLVWGRGSQRLSSSPVWSIWCLLFSVKMKYLIHVSCLDHVYMSTMQSSLLHLSLN